MGRAVTHARSAARRGFRPAALFVPLAVSILVAPLAASALAGADGPTVVPWSRYDTGRVNVVFPEERPAVELIQDANRSLSASLELTGLYELNTATSGAPLVVAAAFPANASGFNATTALGSAGSPVGMYANLGVTPVSGSLWGNMSGIAAGTGPVTATTLAVAFTATTNTATEAGVVINWSVTGFPRTVQGTTFAVSFEFDYANGRAFTACEGSSVLFLAPAACAGSAIGNGSSLWGSQYTSLEGEGGFGPVAVVSWSPSVVYGTAASTVTFGGLVERPGVATFVLGSTPAGNSTARGTVAFALVAPPIGSLSTLYVGSGPVYGISAALLGVAAVAGLVAYRRRDRRLRDGL